MNCKVQTEVKDLKTTDFKLPLQKIIAHLKIEQAYNQITELINKTIRPYQKGRILINQTNKEDSTNKQGQQKYNTKQEALSPEQAKQMIINQFDSNIIHHTHYNKLLAARINNSHEEITKITRIIKKQTWCQYLQSIDHENIGKIFNFIAKQDGRKNRFNEPQAFMPMIINGKLTNNQLNKANNIAKNLIEKHFAPEDKHHIQKKYNTNNYLHIGGKINKQIKKRIKTYKNKGNRLGYQFKPISADEVRYAINDMNDNSAPGPDALGLLVYKQLKSVG